MPVREISAQEFRERTDEVLEEARYEPIALTDKGERQFVIMSAELFRTVYASSRRARDITELTDEEAGKAKAATLPNGFGHLDETLGDE